MSCISIFWYLLLILFIGFFFVLWFIAFIMFLIAFAAGRGNRRNNSGKEEIKAEKVKA